MVPSYMVPAEILLDPMTTAASLAVPATLTTAPAPLKQDALALLQDIFAVHGHRPSSDQWCALEALLETFDRLVLEPKAEPALYVSALDPGVGKTSALVAYLTALLRSEGHRHIGVLVTLSRLSEIRRLAEELRATGGSMAVQTSDDTLNALSTVEETGQAQVLIITQQRLELVCSGRAFSDIAPLRFAGAPRSVRVWDEAFLPGSPLAVPTDDLAAVLRWLRSKSADFHGWVEGVRAEAEQAQDGGVIAVPATDFLDKQMTLNDALRHLRAQAGHRAPLAERDEETLRAIWAMAGRTVTVRKDGPLGPTLVSFDRALPEDLLPLVVLDASTRVRKTYNLMAKVMPVVRLPTATKDYNALTVNVWGRGGGKASMQNKEKWDELVQVLADLVVHEPDRRWLAVGHKASRDIPGLEVAMQKRLGPQAANVDVITWGNHAATNNYADVDRVILAGTLFMRPSYYEALARASVLQDPGDKAFSPEEIEEVVKGENGHLVLQALCRASVRKGNSGAAAPCIAYLVAAKRTGIETMLPDLFPGCQVRPWKPSGPKLPGHAKRTFDFLRDWAKDKPEGAEITFAAVYRALEMNPDVFRKQVRGNKDLEGLLADLCVYVGGTEGRKNKYIVRQKRVL